MNDQSASQPLPLPDAKSAASPPEETSSRGLLRILLLGPRAWRLWWYALVRSVDHAEILAKSEEEATFSFNYAFMGTVASGIAVIGMLLNSPAVIIGAMLISPLMGPIVSSGFALANFDVELGKRAAGKLLLGALASVGFAALIALLSPVKELTPEILARTRPNLFDLAVAILSGIAGGYAMIRGRGGAIVGVAIATALMPPLAVVGYGIATWQWLVFRGSLLLFVTNMVAISLSVAAIAEWYGFGRGVLRKRFARQALISLLVLAPLAVPLFLSLKNIAWESRVQATARMILENAAQGIEGGQVAQLRTRFRDGAPPFVEAILVSDEPRSGLSEQLRQEMQKVLGAPVILRLTQLHADDPVRLSVTLEAERSKALAATAEDDLAGALRKEIPFPLLAVEVDAARRIAVLAPQSRPAVGLEAWREMEKVLAQRHGGWQVTLLPPPAPLPAVDFAPGRDALDDAARERLATAAWAMQHWGMREAVLVGHASSRSQSAQALAGRRLESVGQWLIEHGISVKSRIDSGLLRPGTAAPAAVEIVLPFTAPAAPEIKKP